MFSTIATKVALKKVGLSSNALDFNLPSFSSSSSSYAADDRPPPRQPNKLRKAPPSPRPEGEDDDGDGGSWSSWLSLKSLPLTAQPWLAPPPPPIEVAAVPAIGDAAPRDRDGKLQLGRGRKTLVVFLRCVGCAFAQKTFLNLRTLANRYPSQIRCIAVSHSSRQATQKWIDMLGGLWSVELVIDEDRSAYAAWGLGLGNVWYLFNPTTQAQGWKEKGWLGDKVAGAIQKAGVITTTTTTAATEKTGAGLGSDSQDEGDVSSVMGSKWQSAGAFAVDGQGIVIWGGKALRADDVMNLDEGARLLVL